MNRNLFIFCKFSSLASSILLIGHLFIKIGHFTITHIPKTNPSDLFATLGSRSLEAIILIGLMIAFSIISLGLTTLFSYIGSESKTNSKQKPKFIDKIILK